MSAKPNYRGFPWTQRRTIDGGGKSIVMLRVSCSSCTNFIEKLKNQNEHAPISLAKHFKRQGWAVDLTRPHRNICPRCQERDNAPAKDNVVAIHSAVTTNLIAPAVASTPKERPVTTSTIPDSKPALPSSPAPARQLTDVERDKVREMIEANWLEGRYLNGFSDHRVAQTLGVPTWRVSELREVAFGKIKGDTELEKLVGDISAFRQLMQTQMTTLASMETNLNKLAERVQTAVKRVMP